MLTKQAKAKDGSGLTTLPAETDLRKSNTGNETTAPFTPSKHG